MSVNERVSKTFLVKFVRYPKPQNNWTNQRNRNMTSANETNKENVQQL